MTAHTYARLNGKRKNFMPKCQVCRAVRGYGYETASYEPSSQNPPWFWNNGVKTFVVSSDCDEARQEIKLYKLTGKWLTSA